MPPTRPAPIAALFRSRKVLLAIAATISTLVLHYLDVDPEVWASIDALIGIVIFSIAYEDGAAKSAPAMVQTASGDVSVTERQP